MSISNDDSGSTDEATPPDVAFDLAIRLSVEPLVQLVELLPIRTRAKWEPDLEKRYFRARARGHITVFTADYLSIKMLGVHPAALWGGDYLNLMRELDVRRRLGKRMRD